MLIEQSLHVLVKDEDCGLHDRVKQVWCQVLDFNSKACLLRFQLVTKNLVNCAQVDNLLRMFFLKHNQEEEDDIGFADAGLASPVQDRCAITMIQHHLSNNQTLVFLCHKHSCTI